MLRRWVIAVVLVWGGAAEAAGGDYLLHLPGGVVNLLTGDRAELLEHFASHMDVNAVVYCGSDEKERTAVRTKSALNVKRAVVYEREDWSGEDSQGPYFILDTQEVKTTWHPIGV